MAWDLSKYLRFGDEENDDIPEGCAACGGDYPHCKSSCPLFDDDE